MAIGTTAATSLYEDQLAKSPWIVRARLYRRGVRPYAEAAIRFCTGPATQARSPERALDHRFAAHEVEEVLQRNRQLESPAPVAMRGQVQRAVEVRRQLDALEIEALHQRLLENRDV